MADVPPQPLGRCSPQRAGETDSDHVARFRAHRDAGRQRFLDNYYQTREARLPSPNSEEGLDDEEMAMEVAHIEREIRIENGRPEPGDIPPPVALWPKVTYPPGKSLSECSESDHEYDWRGRPEDYEYDETLTWGTPVSSPKPKRARSPSEDHVHEPPAKRTRMDTTSAVHPAEPRISGGKRKSIEVDDLQDDDEKAQAVSGRKKRRPDAPHDYTPMLSSPTSSSTRKRKSDSDKTHESEVSTHQSLDTGCGASGAKRRKMEDEARTSHAAAGKTRNRIAPVTRFRRRHLSGLSGADAQLVQLGERGRVELQRQVIKTQGRATDAAPSRSILKQSSTTTTTNNIEPEPETTITKSKANNTIPKTRNTKIGAKRKSVTFANTRNDTGVNSKVAAASEASTVTRTGGTKARRRQPVR